jgi:hypothetical protein
MKPDSLHETDSPLLSRRTLYKITGIVVALGIATSVISFGGRWLGERMALGGHSESTETFDVVIGQDTIQLSANMLRFKEQRRNGATERADVYLTWPEMAGYSAALRTRFDNVSEPASLIFLQMSQSTMSRDMSGRLQPIYEGLFEGPAEAAEHGLTRHRLRADSGYGNEVILTGLQPGAALPYVVRCLFPSTGERPTSGDCQRDIRVGQDLTVLYRFSSALLKDWQQIDAAVQTFVQTRLVPGRPQTQASR